MSRTFSTIPAIASSASRLVASTSTWRQRSSAWRTRNSADGGLTGGLTGGRRDEREQPRDLVARWISSLKGRPASASGSIAEGLLDRRADVVDHRVQPDDADHIGGVLDQRAEARLRALLGALLGQRDALQRERDLAGERGEALLGGVAERVLGVDRQRPLQALAREHRRQAHLVAFELEHDHASGGLARRAGSRGACSAGSARARGSVPRSPPTGTSGPSSRSARYRHARSGSSTTARAASRAAS